MDYMESQIEPEDSLIQCIRNYLNHYVEPDYKNLTYQKNHYTKEKYDHETANNIIKEHRQFLEDRLKRLDEFQFFVNKNSFPDKFNDYLLRLLTINSEVFYEMMNKDCEEPRQNDSDLWQEKWTPNNLDINYCKDGKYCDSCQNYINIIGEYNDYENRLFHTGNEDDEEYHYRFKIPESNNEVEFTRTIIINKTEPYDYYEQRFTFKHYYFLIGIKISKVNQKELSGYYIANFECDMTNPNYCRVWDLLWNQPKMYKENLYLLANYMKIYSEPLYEKYKEYCKN